MMQPVNPAITDLPLKTAGDFRAALIDYVGLLLALVLEIVVFSLISAHQGRAFFSADTFRTIINELPAGAIMTVGMTYVLMIGGIDLSVGSVMGLSSAVVGVLMVQCRESLPLAVAAGIAAGLVCGLINGLISVGWRLPSFIVTLGMLEIARGMIHVVTGSHTQYVGDAVGNLASVSVGGLSLLFFIAAIIVVAGQVVLQRTVFGRYVTAIGNNELAVRYSGVNPGSTKTLVYILCGLLAGIAGVVEVA
ncbi:MAG: ABC transporter permease, partial [Tepidisphaeraceae bacterium]